MWGESEYERVRGGFKEPLLLIHDQPYDLSRAQYEVR